MPSFLIYVEMVKVHDVFGSRKPLMVKKEMLLEGMITSKEFLSSTLVRYKLPVVVIVFNNGGVYGGDRRSPEGITGPFIDGPAPTSFVPGAAYHTLIEAFGGKGYLVETPDELQSALSESFSTRKPAVINVIIDLFAGAESGRMQHKN
ncbi:hypothetical protein SLEP1_g36832 [Rubroshorea leprosula]|uniref:2-hydroxyacyl-CoA lyase n=1 Tax=Rubroshorea leprosula TaxID=152421 RepID=A0AAV5KSP5_9ROSI|nr:hypothetical protein SLEP1_g36832 [Rubroshorea leprosula]